MEPAPRINSTGIEPGFASVATPPRESTSLAANVASATFNEVACSFQNKAAELGTSLIAFLERKKAFWTDEELIELYTYANGMNVKDALPSLFGEINLRMKFHNIESTCALLDRYTGPRYQSVQELLLMHLTVCLVPTCGWDKVALTDTQRLEKCTLNGEPLRDHPVFRACAYLLRFEEKTAVMDETFHQLCAQLPEYAGKWLRSRGEYRTKDYLNSWNSTKELFNRYPHWSYTKEFYDLWEPDVEALPKVIPALLEQEPDDPILRRNRFHLIKKQPQLFDAKMLHLFVNDVEFLINNDKRYADREGAYYHALKDLTSLIQAKKEEIDTHLFVHIMSVAEDYFIAYCANLQEEDELILEMANRLVYTSTVLSSRLIRPLTPKVLALIKRELAKNPTGYRESVVLKQIEQHFP